MPDALRGPRALLLLAFASIWFVWGSTFLAIRWAIDGIPPILMCGLRLSAAGDGDSGSVPASRSSSAGDAGGAGARSRRAPSGGSVSTIEW